MFTEEDRMGTLTFTLCAADQEAMDANKKYSRVVLALDGQELSDDEQSSSDFEFDDIYGRFENRPCMGWSVGYEELLPGHHELLITMDVTKRIEYEDSYYEPGTYEFALHFLVQKEQVAEVQDEE